MCIRAKKKKRNPTFLPLFFLHSPADPCMLDCDLGLSISCSCLWWCPFCTSKIRAPVCNFNQRGEWGGERGGTEREGESRVEDWLWKREKEWERGECVRNRETVKEREGGQNVYMLCSSTQHQPAYGSPAVLADKTVSMREKARKRKERERAQKNKKKEQGKHNCKSGIRMRVLSQQGICYCSQGRTALPVGFERRSVSSGCFALWAVIAAAIGTVRHLNWGCSKAWSQE